VCIAIPQPLPPPLAVFARRNNHVICLHCPWLARYVAFAVLTLGRVEDQKSRIVGFLDDVAGRADDPMIQLVRALYVDYDLGSAKKALTECESVLASDYFFSMSDDSESGSDLAT